MAKLKDTIIFGNVTLETGAILDNSVEANLDITETNINLNGAVTAQNISTDYIDFDTDPTIPEHAIGRLHWNIEDETLEVGINSEVKLQIGQEFVIKVLNETGVDIPNGKLVTSSGTGTLHPSIELLDISASNLNILGMTTQTILNGEYGFVTRRGTVRDIDTSSFSPNDRLWASDTLGGVTNIRPDAPNLIVSVGSVLNSDASAGSIVLNLDIMQKSVNFNSAGVYELPVYTENAGNIVLGDGVYVFAIDGDGSSPYRDFIIAGAEYVLTDLVTNYVVADYNSGSPIIEVLTSPATINQLNIIPIYTIFRRGTHLEIIDWDYGAKSMANKLSDRFVRTKRFEPEINALLLSELPTRIIKVDVGYIWQGHARVYLADSISNEDDCYLNYHDTGVWTRSLITQYDNTQYDNGTDLANLTPNKYAVNWIYRVVATNISELNVFLGSSSYGSLADAKESQPPANLPAGIITNSLLVGRIIVKYGVDTASSIESAFDSEFRGSSVANHNDLANIQGGAIGDYYHPTLVEYTVLQNTSGTNTGDEVFEYADLASLPVTGVAGVVYVVLDTNLIYRWSGSAYIQTGGVPYSGATADLDMGAHTVTATEFIATSTTAGQSTINKGLVVNESGGGEATDSFRVETDTVSNALFVDAVNDIVNINAKFKETFTTITNDITLGLHLIIYVDATSNDIDITLPTASDYSGIKYEIKRIDSSAFSVNVLSDSLDNEITQALTFPEAMTVRSDGSKWWIF